MADTKSDKAIPEIREAIDANDHDGLSRDPGHADGKTDIAVDESFPASDPPATNPGTSGEPAPSSGFNEAAEQAVQEKRGRIEQRAHALWESEGRPEGQDVDHWLRAEADEKDERDS